VWIYSEGAISLQAAQGDHRELSVASTTRPHRISSEIPFLAAGARWQGDNAQIRIRASNDARRWSEWIALHPAADGPETASGEQSAQLVFFDWNSRFLEYESDRPVRFILIDPGRTSAKQLAEIRAMARTLKPERADAKVEKPAAVSRTAWGCPDGENAREPVSYTTVTHLIVHHTADSFTGNDYAAWIRAIWRYHVFNNGWIDVGYNYLIDPEGTIYVGRAGGDNVLGAHFSCQNSGTMGVAMLGTYTNQLPSAKALDSLKQLLAWKADQLNLDPTARTFHAGMNQDLAVISGHRDGNNSPRSCTRTECPGDAFYPTLGTIAQDVRAIIARQNVTVLLRQDAETEPADWQYSGLWHRTDRKTAAGAMSWWFGREATGDYDTPGEAPAGELVSPEINLSADAELSFRSWYDTEPEGLYWDRKLVEIRVNGGEWQTIDRVTGQQKQWTNQSYPLTARGRVQIRFRFDAGDAMMNQFEGWYLDDIQITASN
jgi:hypothetical protein